MVNSGDESHQKSGEECQSAKSVICTLSYNRFLGCKEMNNSSYLAAQYKWASSSEEAKKTNSLEQYFLEKFSVFIEQGTSFMSKEGNKMKKTRASAKIVGSVQNSWGPFLKKNPYAIRFYSRRSPNWSILLEEHNIS